LANRALRNLLGIEEGDFEIVDSAPSAAAPDSGDFSGRAELAAVRHRERAAEEQVRGANAGYLPRISAFGRLDYDYGPKFESGGGSYTAAVAPMGYLDGNRLVQKSQSSGNPTSREEQRKVGWH
jgi:outer membrane protein TolC